MSDLRDLYQEIILDHNKRPRNFRCPEDANRKAQGDNPLCGDKVTIYVTLKDGIVKDVGFQGRGCAISVASASLMTEALKGKTEAAARALFKRFHANMIGGSPEDQPDDPEMDKLSVLSGVREYPMRVKCATLSWHTLVAALDREDHPVSTETADGL